jgi:hypothetical protein
VNANGSLTSPLWSDLTNVDPFYHDAVNAMKAVVEKSKVVKMKYLDKPETGAVEKGGFNHFYFDLSVKSASNHSVHAKQSLQYWGQVTELLTTIDLDLIKRAWDLFTFKDSLASRKLGGKAILDNIIMIKEQYDNIKHNVYKNNFVWGIAGTLNFNIINFKNTVMGKFVSDLADSTVTEDAAISMYCAMTAPENYMRPTELPSDGLKVRAEKLIAELELETAMGRRLCTFNDILKLKWKPKISKDDKEVSEKVGVFAAVKTKQDAEKEPVNENIIQGGNITLVRFVEEILPNANSLKFYVDYHKQAFGAFATAADKTANPIIRWDSLEAEVRNPVTTLCAVHGDHSGNWGLDSGKYHDVLGICLDPSEWFYGEANRKHQYSFLMEAEYPIKHAIGTCLFPDTLRSELFEIRKVIEEFSNATPMQVVDKPVIALTAGPGSNAIGWKIMVTTDSAKVAYTIDRFN